MAMEPPSQSPRDILRQVRQIEIRTRRFVNDTLVGAYHSVFKGRGVEFAEVREYSPGDDVRTIDWNVTAKSGTPFVKVFEEERELTFLLLVDVSGSGQFGSAERSKRELAAELACVLAFSATRNHDKVGLLLFSDTVEAYLAPRKGRQHVLRVIREVLFHRPRRTGTDIASALRFLNRVQRRRAIVFLLSDFLVEGVIGPEPQKDHRPTPSTLGKTLALTNRRHDLVCLELTDPREQTLPSAGIIRLEDSETGRVVELDTSSRRLRERYAAANEARRERLRALFRTHQVDAITLSTDTPYIDSLRRFFLRREQRR